MSPVNGELVSKLESKTAKIGDSVVLQTNAPVKTADGIEILKGEAGGPCARRKDERSGREFSGCAPI
jgi:hypothetical protein